MPEMLDLSKEKPSRRSYMRPSLTIDDPSTSPAYRRRTERLRIIQVCAFAIASISALIFVGADQLIYSFRAINVYLYMRTVTLWALGGILFAATLIVYAEIQRASARISYFRELEADSLTKLDNETWIDTDATPDLTSNTNDHGRESMYRLLEATRAQMRAYDAIARGQAASSYFASLSAMAVGLVILVTGVAISYFAANTATKYATASLAAIGSVISGYISRTFLLVQQRATNQLGYYFQQPLVQSYILMAERLAYELDESSKNAVLRDVIDGILANLLQPTTGSRKGRQKDGDTRGKGRRSLAKTQESVSGAPT